jgi:guanylate kinase
MANIIALTAPSGSGKTTIARRVLEAFPEMKFSVSATTRPRRPGEKDGVHYHFVSEAKFRQYIQHGELIEYEEVYPGRFYGTLRREVERVAHDFPVLLDIDVQGAQHVKNLYKNNVLTLFIRPPSLEVLAERLRSRGTETEKTLAERIEKAKHEITFADHFDAVVVNDDLENAVVETLVCIQAFLDRD